MILTDLHVHTNYCDGKNNPEEMVLAAIEKGMECIGFSVHSYTEFDTSFCIKSEKVADYKAEINGLKEKYKDKIRILCGTEMDYFSEMPTDGLDYIIGSVHYVKSCGEYIAVDESEQTLVDCVNKYFDGDFYSFAEAYYKNVAHVLEKTKADIIGHFDLVTKFNEGGKLFDESNPRYVAAFKAAVDSLLPYGKPFEINTGAISRGYRTKPYPSPQIVEYIRSKGGKTILTSDSHSKDTLCYEFEKWGKY